MGLFKGKTAVGLEVDGRFSQLHTESLRRGTLSFEAPRTQALVILNAGVATLGDDRQHVSYVSMADCAFRAAMHTELKLCEGAHEVSLGLMIAAIGLVAGERIEEFVHITRIDGASRHSYPSGRG